MKTRSIDCSRCGAPLQVEERARVVTCQYCSSQVEVVHEPNAEEMNANKKMADDLEVIRLQNELRLLDQEWSMRQSELAKDVHARDGIGKAVTGVFTMLLFFVVFARSPFLFGGLRVLPIIALMVILVFGSLVFMFSKDIAKMRAKKQAQFIYRRRRRELLRLLAQAEQR